jgi:hypothetical protein
MVYMAMRQYQMRNIGGIQAEHFNIAHNLREAFAGSRVNQNQRSDKIYQINRRVIG